MTVDEALTYCGHVQAKLARLLGVTKNTVTRWKQNDLIPYIYQCQLEVDTNGKLKATREDKFR